MAYLDNTGLAYFWGKIKAWANSAFALLGHTHPSSDVTLMTGYSKPSSSSAISASDSLNQAVGKLEKGLETSDGNAVHKTGDELVQGIKTFKNAHSWITGGAAALSSIQLQSTIIERSSDPAQNSFAGIVILDKNAVSDLDHVNRLGALEFGKLPNSTSFINIKAYKPNNISSETADILVGYDVNGITYAMAPSTSSSRLAGGDIVTRDWIPRDTRLVHTTGDENISGAKAFTNNTVYVSPATSVAQISLTNDASNTTKRRVWLRNDGDSLWFLCSDVNSIDSWNSDRPLQLKFLDKTIATNYDFNIINNSFKVSDGIPDVGNGRAIHALDSNGNSTHNIIFYRYSNGATTLFLRAHNAFNTSDYADIRLDVDENGNKSASCPTPPDSSNSSFIATTEWVRRYCTTTANFVTVDGTQEISGTKTFTSELKVNSQIRMRTALYSVIFRNDGNAFYILLTNQNDPDGNFNTKRPFFISLAEGYAYGTTPPTYDNTTKLATTAFVKSQGYLTSHQSLSNYVTLDGAQTITGQKTFTSYLGTNNNLGLQKTTGENYILSNFSGLATPTSNPSATCSTAYILRANDGNFALGTYMQVYPSGDVRHFLRHNHYSSSASTGLVFYSYEALAEGYFCVQTDNKYRLGIPDHRWSAVYAATAAIQTSDERMKVDVAPVPDKVLDVWEDVEWKQFKFTDSVEEKGLDGARLHAGAVAQSIGRAFAAAGLDASRYGFYCYDSWDAKDATYDGNGQILDAAQEAGDRYSLRYGEALCIEAAYQRRENVRLKKRVADLEERLAALELKVS